MTTVYFLLASLVILPAEAEDYVIIFAADSVPYKATGSHAFAALVRVERVPGCPPRITDVDSISWLPVTMKVRRFAVRAEAGHNVPLHETLRHYTAPGSHVCMWGPYRVEPWLAETFKARSAAVTSSYQYKGACFFSPRMVCDCARSVEEMLGTRRRYIGVFGYGAAAGSVIVQKMSPWLIEPQQCHPWVATMIGLDEYPLVCRPYGDYTSRWQQLEASFPWKWK